MGSKLAIGAFILMVVAVLIAAMFLFLIRPFFIRNCRHRLARSERDIRAAAGSRRPFHSVPAPDRCLTFYRPAYTQIYRRIAADAASESASLVECGKRYAAARWPLPWSPFGSQLCC